MLIAVFDHGVVRSRLLSRRWWLLSFSRSCGAARLVAHCVVCDATLKSRVQSRNSKTGVSLIQSLRFGIVEYVGVEFSNFHLRPFGIVFNRRPHVFDSFFIVSMSRRLGNTLPLKVFIRRQQVLTLYRNLLKTSRGVSDGDVRQGIQQEIRSGFAQCKTLTDSSSIKTSIVAGQRSLTQLEDMCGVKPSSSAKQSIPDAGSWINTKDKDDVRGRVGTGWPWK